MDKPKIKALSLPKHYENPKLFNNMKLLFENWRRFVALHEGVNPKTIKKIVDAIQSTQSHGDPNRPGERLYGEIYTVGGAVRDEIIPGAPQSKDVDFVVRNLTLKQIKNAIQSLQDEDDLGGDPKEVGAKFSVVTSKIDGLDFDFALPRKLEKKTGVGHGDVEVVADPFLPIDADMERRDFTMNAIAKTAGGDIVDNAISQQGIKDIQDGVIRAVGEAEDRFRNDPLRMLRAIQFATRFNFKIADETAAAINSNLDMLTPEAVSGERVLVEFEKAWSKGAANSAHFIELLESTGIGKHIFGEDFNPRPAVVSGGRDRIISGNAMAFFMHGGDYKKMRPSGLMVKHIELARASITDQEVYEYGSKYREVLPLLVEVLQQVGYPEKSEKIQRILDANLPLSSKELAIGGREIVQLGLKGPIIGQMQAKLLQAVHAGEVENEGDALLNYLRMLVGSQ